MKKGWEYKKLGDICYSVQDGDWIESKDQSPNGIRLIQTGNIGNGVYKDKQDSAKYISEETFKRLNCTEIFEGDILVSRLPDPVGRACILPDLGCRCITAVDCSILRLKKDIVCNAWISYYMQSLAYFSLIKAQCTGSTRLRITRKKLSEILIPIPPLSEQQSIVDYLDSAFAKIDAMKANAEKALNEAKALFQASLKEMLEPKDGWEEKILGDIAVDSADGPFGSNLKKEHYTTNKEVRIIQLSNIGEDGWREENTKYTTFEHLKNISRSEVEPNDIVIAKMMPAGRAILCPSHEKKFVLSSDAVKIKLKKGLETRFILHSINSPYFRKEVYENVTGSGRVRTSLTKLRACKIYLPSIGEQQTIIATLDSLKSKVDRLQENYDKISQECDALKQAILRQVFE